MLKNMSNLNSLKEAHKEASTNINNINKDIQNSQNNIKNLEARNAAIDTQKNQVFKEIEEKDKIISAELEKDGTNGEWPNEQLIKVTREEQDKLYETHANLTKEKIANDAKISNEIDSINYNQEKKKQLGYTEEDLENLNELMKDMEMHEKNSASKYNISQITGSDGGVHPDIRNLPGAINFRSYGTKYTESLNNVTKDSAGKSSLARAFYMNQDFLFTNSLASPIPLGKVSHDTMPEIQPLIINEFQPYEMVSLKDVMNLLESFNIFGGDLMNLIINIGRSRIVNSMIDKTYKNPGELYLNRKI